MLLRLASLSLLLLAAAAVVVVVGVVVVATVLMLAVLPGNCRSFRAPVTHRPAGSKLR